MKSLGVEMSQGDLNNMYTEMDPSGDGQIDFKEFSAVLPSLLSLAFAFLSAASPPTSLLPRVERRMAGYGAGSRGAADSCGDGHCHFHHFGQIW